MFRHIKLSFPAYLLTHPCLGCCPLGKPATAIGFASRRRPSSEISALFPVPPGRANLLLQWRAQKSRQPSTVLREHRVNLR